MDPESLAAEATEEGFTPITTRRLCLALTGAASGLIGAILAVRTDGYVNGCTLLAFFLFGITATSLVMLTEG